MKSPITTHVLDTSTGRPAADVAVTLERKIGNEWVQLGRGVTDSDGRLSDLVEGDVDSGVCRLTFDSAAYFGNRTHFYPVVRIEFYYTKDGRHHHVPLLINPYGYTTYRGS